MKALRRPDDQGRISHSGERSDGGNGEAGRTIAEDCGNLNCVPVANFDLGMVGTAASRQAGSGADGAPNRLHLHAKHAF